MFEYLNLTKKEIEEGAAILQSSDYTADKFKNWFNELPPANFWFKLIDVDNFVNQLDKLVRSGNTDRALKLYSVGASQDYAAIVSTAARFFATIIGVLIAIIAGIIWAANSSTPEVPMAEPDRAVIDYDSSAKLVTESDCKEFAKALDTESKMIKGECWFLNKNGWEKKK